PLSTLQDHLRQVGQPSDSVSEGQRTPHLHQRDPRWPQRRSPQKIAVDRDQWKQRAIPREKNIAAPTPPRDTAGSGVLMRRHILIWIWLATLNSTSTLCVTRPTTCPAQVVGRFFRPLNTTWASIWAPPNMKDTMTALRYRHAKPALTYGLPERRYLPELHGVRGLALAGVVLFHLFGNGRVSGGIDIFLAVSGFLFTGMLLREAANRAGRIDPLKYYGRLIRRI